MRKLTTGNYFGYYKGFYVFIRKKEHGAWCCSIGRKGEWLYGEGFLGTSLPTIPKATAWYKNKINSLNPTPNE